MDKELAKNSEAQELLNKLEKLSDEDKVIIYSKMSLEYSVYKTPLPSPTVLKDYEAVIPGAADTILKQVEAQQKQRMKEEDRIIRAQIRVTYIGQVIGFIIAIAFILLAYLLGTSGHDVLAGTIVTVALAMVVVFVLRVVPKSQKE